MKNIDAKPYVHLENHVTVGKKTTVISVERMTNVQQNKRPIKKKEVTAEEIDGIIYYIDLDGNVYHTEDVLEDKKNPRIIARLPRKVGVTNYTMDQVEWLTEFKETYGSLRDPL